MRTRSILLSAILMAAITPAFAQATSGTQGLNMRQDKQAMPMHQNGSNIQMMNCMQMGNSMQMGQGKQGIPMGKNMLCSNQTAKGTGVVEAVDTASGTVTIKHQAIASIHWPTMMMTFKAEPPSLLTDIKVGEKVNFTLHPDGMHSTVTAIASAK